MKQFTTYYKDIINLFGYIMGKTCGEKENSADQLYRNFLSGREMMKTAMFEELIENGIQERTRRFRNLIGIVLALQAEHGKESVIHTEPAVC